MRDLGLYDPKKKKVEVKKGEKGAKLAERLGISNEAAPAPAQPAPAPASSGSTPPGGTAASPTQAPAGGTNQPANNGEQPLDLNQLQHFYLAVARAIAKTYPERYDAAKEFKIGSPEYKRYVNFAQAKQSQSGYGSQHRNAGVVGSRQNSQSMALRF